MQKTNPFVWMALIAVAIIAISACLYVRNNAPLAGGTSIVDELDATARKIGTNGSRLGPLIATSCNLSQSSAGSHSATTSKEYFCAVTGVVAGDLVTVDLPAGAGANTGGGAASLYGGFVAQAAYATTTGFIGVEIVNLTGAATSSFPQATTTVDVFAAHPVSSVPGL